jgi:3-oxoacyl-[acyl-carrier protein] reductase
MFDLKNEVAIVTGSSRGIGADIAKALASCGCAVAINYFKNPEKAETVVSSIKESGGKAMAFQADVSNPDSAQDLIDQTLGNLGTPTILVNNAASPMIHKKIAKTDWSDFASTFDMAVKATYNCCRSVMPHMKKNKRGKIVNVVTQYVYGVPPFGMATYVTSKYALEGFSKSLAMELAPNVQVNMVSPGLTETDLVSGLPDSFKQSIAQQTPMKRNTELKDISNAVLFLVSPLSNYLTGTNLPVCGGNVM